MHHPIPVRELSQRLHVLLSPEQAERLRHLSEASGQPIGQLVRDALQQTYAGADSVASRAALNRVAGVTYLKEETWESVRSRLRQDG